MKYHFDRFYGGKKMAQGVIVEADSLLEAKKKAEEVRSRPPFLPGNLVYKNHSDSETD